jgi:hypothetical protein
MPCSISGLANEVSTDPVDEDEQGRPRGRCPQLGEATRAMRGKVIDRLMTVTVNTPAKRGSRVFDDKDIAIVWKKRRRARAA